MGLHFLDRSVQTFVAASGEGDITALFGKRRRNGIADALARAGDRRILTFETEIHVCAPIE